MSGRRAGGLFLALEFYLWPVRRPCNVAIGTVCRPPSDLAVVLMLASPPGGSSGQTLCELFNIPAHTLKRWRRWWREDFPCTPFWQSVRERFVPPVTTAQLPQSLLERFEAGALRDRLAQSLRFIAPLSTRATVK